MYAVVHLAVHLENGQRVYFTEQTAALQQALTAPKTTLTEFFSLFNRQDVVGQFANTFMYIDVPNCFTWNKQEVGNHGSKVFQDSRTHL